MASYSTKGSHHYTGMYVSNSQLFVLEQKSRSLLQFELSSGLLVDTLFQDLPDLPEQLLFVDEC